ncbi:MAG: hypothetical protein RMX97_00675 [Nostoc sp. DedQUE11]|nr:hypothetical protein [Nostoc sp. DedQUE11]
MAEASRREGGSLRQAAKRLLQHGVNKPPILNQRNADAVLILNFVSAAKPCPRTPTEKQATRSVS